MPSSDTTVVPVRLSKLTLELVDQQAKLRRMSRSTWMREIIMLAIQQQQQRADLEGLEQRLKLQFDAVISQINGHTTSEIDTLTRS